MEGLRSTKDGSPRRWGRGLFALALLALAGGWIFFAPSQLGGSVDYVIVHGNSMEPLLHQGDLAIVRPADSYEPGDVVAYRSAQVGQIVLHRIEKIEAGRYVLKGDNNNFIDPEEPVRADLVGEMQFHIGGAGHILQALSTPFGAVAVAVVIAAIVGLAARGDEREDERMVEAVTSGALLQRFTGPSRRVLTIAGAAVVVFGALGLNAYSRPEWRLTEKQVSFTQEGRFSYSAPIRKRSAAGDGSVGNGEPVFTRLSDRVNVRFEYRYPTAERDRVSGKVRLITRLSNVTGWNRTLSTSRVTDVVKGKASVSQTIEFDRLNSLIRAVERETGTAITDYQVNFQAQAGLVGKVAGQRIAEEFSPQLSLNFDGNQLVLDGGLDAAPEALRRTEESFVTVTTNEPNRMSLLWLDLEVGLARWIAVAGGVLALTLFILFGWIYLRALRGPESDRFEALYGDYMVPIKAGQIREAIEVDNMEALVRLAASYEAMILHEHASDTNAYYVLGGNNAYVYRAGTGEGVEEVAELIPLLRSVTFVEELGDSRPS